MRIFLGLAIIAALAAGTLNVLQVRNHITTLITQRDDYHTKLTDTQGKLTKTQNDLAKTKTDLAQTQQQLTDSQAAQKKAEAVAAAQQKKADDYAAQLAKATQDRDTAQAELAAYKGTGKSPQEILGLIALIKQNQDTINALNEEGKKLNQTIARLNNQLQDLLGNQNRIVPLPAGLKG